MGKTWHDAPAKKRDIEAKKHARGDHRRMDPYSRAKESHWRNSEFN